MKTLLVLSLLFFIGCKTPQQRMAQLDKWVVHINEMESEGLIEKEYAQERRQAVLDEQIRISTGPTPGQQALANMLFLNMSSTSSYDPSDYASTRNAWIQSLGSYRQPLCYGAPPFINCY